MLFQSVWLAIKNRNGWLRWKWDRMKSKKQHKY